VSVTPALAVLPWVCERASGEVGALRGCGGGRQGWRGEAELTLLSTGRGARDAKPRTKGKRVAQLSAGSGRVRGEFSAPRCQPPSVSGWDPPSCCRHLGLSCGQWRRRSLEGNFTSPWCAPPRWDGWPEGGEAWTAGLGLALVCWRYLASPSLEAAAAVVIRYTKVCEVGSHTGTLNS